MPVRPVTQIATVLMGLMIELTCKDGSDLMLIIKVDDGDFLRTFQLQMILR